jgi:hypothetical protein
MLTFCPGVGVCEKAGADAQIAATSVDEKKSARMDPPSGLR